MTNRALAQPDAATATPHDEPSPQRRLRVLFVPDCGFWVTGTIARQIARHHRWIEPLMCSGNVLRHMVNRFDGLPFDYDVLHVLTPGEAGATFAKLPWDRPRVTTIHHVAAPEDGASADRADAVMTVCRQWHEHLQANGVAADRLVRVPNGVDTDAFAPPTAEQRRAVRARLGLPRDAFVVGFCGKRSSDAHGRKGLDVLIEAIGQLTKRVPHAALLLVGPGWEDVVQQQRAAGITCVQSPFVAAHAEVAAFYQAMNLFWVTARVEGGPVPLMEAMACGCPAVSTPVGIARELIDDGVNGALAPMDDAAAIVERTVTVARDHTLRAAMGRAARETIEREWTWSRQTAPAVQLYRAAITQFANRRDHAPLDLTELNDRFVTEHAVAQAEKGGRTGDAPTFNAALPARLRRWIDAQESLTLMHELERNGERTAARRLARRTLCRRPLDRDVWKHAAPMLGMGPLWRGARSCVRACRELAARWRITGTRQYET